MAGFPTEQLDWASTARTKQEVVQEVLRILDKLEVNDYAECEVQVHTMSGPAGWPVISVTFPRYTDRQLFEQDYFHGEQP